MSTCLCTAEGLAGWKWNVCGERNMWPSDTFAPEISPSRPQKLNWAKLSQPAELQEPLQRQLWCDLHQMAPSLRGCQPSAQY